MIQHTLFTRIFYIHDTYLMRAQLQWRIVNTRGILHIYIALGAKSGLVKGALRHQEL